MSVISGCQGAPREEHDGREPVLLTVRRPSGVQIFSSVWNGRKTLRHVLASKAVGEPRAGTIWSFVLTGSGCPELADVAVEPLRLDTVICDIAENSTGVLVSLLLDITLVAMHEWRKYVAVVRDTLDARPIAAWRTTVATEHVHCFACVYHHLEDILELFDLAGSSAAAIDDFLVGRGVDPTIFACSVHQMLHCFANSMRHRTVRDVRKMFLEFIKTNF